jgi:hypothetical protein
MSKSCDRASKTENAGSTSILKKAKTEISRIRKGIIRELNRCKETGKQVIVNSEALDEQSVVSSVEDIYVSGKDEIVVLKWYDRNNLASQTHLFIEEILSVHPVNKMKSNLYSFGR